MISKLEDGLVHMSVSGAATVPGKEISRCFIRERNGS